mgnify:FL=1
MKNLLADNKLDIMFFDRSDWAGDQLRFSWITGGLLYRLFGGVEVTGGFLNWQDALRWLAEVEPGQKINSIQFWGHGSPGRVWINNEYLSIRSLYPGNPHRDLLLKIKSRLTPESTIWFRCCSVFAKEEGHVFATTFSQFMNCRIAAHTHIIGPWQSGLHSILPGRQPSWSTQEGVGKNPDGTTKILWSKPWSTNTIFCLTGKIPEGW